MRVLSKGLTGNQVICKHCHAVLEIEPKDLQWTHVEETYYYVVCPECKNKVWIKGNDELDKMYKQKSN